MITERQYQKLMKTFQENGGNVSDAALRAGVSRETATDYLKDPRSPEERRRMRDPRTYRTRPDPVVELWPLAVSWLEPTPELDAKALFEHLLGEHPEWIAGAGRSLRTFQRRVHEWRVKHGPEKEIFFPQVREPGQSMQFDWTHLKELSVTIGGKPFEHLLAHAVLPYSNWEWAVPCRSESLLSLKRGAQEALWALGGVPAQLQTDQSSTATHVLKRGQARRVFNEEYLALCKHLGIEARTIHVRSPDENGDVESAHAHLKRRLRNHLILRGSRDFSAEADYGAFLAKICTGANALRLAKLEEERPHLRPLPSQRFPEYQEVNARVSGASLVRVKDTPYSVPSQLVGTIVRACVTEDEVAVYRGSEFVVRHPRGTGKTPQVDYRHVIHSLVRKPGAFRNCAYREQLFPDRVFRQAYERLRKHEERRADAHYVQVLALAAERGEAAVSAILAECLRNGEIPLPEHVENVLCTTASPAAAATMAPFTPQLGAYDRLLGVQP
jgi:transposase